VSVAAPKATYTLGLDLGQAADFSALALIERPAPASEEDRRQRPVYLLRALKRWKLGTPYPDIVADVGRIPRECPELEGAVLVVDRGGVGAAVADMFRQARPPLLLRYVLITAGNAVTGDGVNFNVAKVELISPLLVAFQSQRIKAATALPDWKLLKKELQNYRTKTTAAANDLFNAREGEHDDLVLALALAVWHSENFGGSGGVLEVIHVPSRFPERCPFGRARDRRRGPDDWHLV
jgi:hypothetical protein